MTGRMRSIRAFWHDESGQSLAFAAVTFFAVVMVGLLVVGIGQATNAQMEAQNAADTAAYAGSQVLADSVSQIAWLNNAMAHIYYHGMRYAVDTASLATLAEMKEHQPYYGTWEEWAVLLGKDVDAVKALFAPSDAEVGVAGVMSEYENAYDQAAEWIPRAEAWLKRLSRIQRGIAVLAPEAVKAQIGYTALQNGAERFAYYPGFILVPRDPVKQTCSVGRISASNDPPGWAIWSETDGYRIEARHRAPDFTATPNPVRYFTQSEWQTLVNDWLNDIFSHYNSAPPDRWLELSAVPFYPVAHSNGQSYVAVQDDWNITMQEPGMEEEIVVEVSAYHRLGSGGASSWQSFPSVYYIHTQVGSSKTIEDLIVAFDRENVIHYQRSADDAGVVEHGDREVEVEDTPDATIYRITEDGETLVYRQNSDGSLEIWNDLDGNGPGDLDDDEWFELPETTYVDGVEIPIDYDLGLGVNSNYPIRIHIRKATITIVEPVRIHYHTPQGWWVYVDDDYATINGVSTRDPHEKWRRVHSHGHNYEETSSRTYHRLLEIEEDDPLNHRGEWRYEWVRVGSYMQDMGMQTFAQHAVMANDPYYLGMDAAPDLSAYPRSEDDDLWQAFPVWARPRRDEAAMAQVDWVTTSNYFPLDYGGWFDIAQGRPHTMSSRYTMYSQTRPCWFCDEFGTGGATLDDVDDSTSVAEVPSPTAGQSCVRPAGFFYWPVSDAYLTALGLSKQELITLLNFQVVWEATPAGSRGDLIAAREKWRLLLQGSIPDGYELPSPIPFAGNYGLDLKGKRAVDVPGASPATLQIVCPVCARKFLYASGQNEIGGDFREVEWGCGPPFQPDVVQFRNTPSFVRKYMAHGLGRQRRRDRERFLYHRDGGGAVVAPLDALAQALQTEDCMSIQPAVAFNEDIWQPPLALTAEFFRKGMTVGVWKETVASQVYSILGGNRTDAPSGGEAAAGMRNPYPTDEELSPHLYGQNVWGGASTETRARWMWGHFGVSSARQVFWNDVEYTEPVRDIAFGWDGVRPSWITETLEEIDVLEREVNWNREIWLRSPMNLFDPDWDARVINARNVLVLEDVYLEEDYPDGIPDTALSFLFSEIARESWPASLIELHDRTAHWNYRNPEWAVRQYWRQMGAPPWQGEHGEGRSVNYEDPDFEKVYLH